jgi:hypothetical protein
MQIERNETVFAMSGFWHRRFQLIKISSTVQKNKLTLVQLESQFYVLFFFVVVWAVRVLNLLVLKVAIRGKIIKNFKATFGRNLYSRSQLSSLFLGPGREKSVFLVLVAFIYWHCFERFLFNC